MSNNCLVTKLKSSVDNDNLPIYGEFSIRLQPISQGQSSGPIYVRKNESVVNYDYIKLSSPNDSAYFSLNGVPRTCRKLTIDIFDYSDTPINITAPNDQEFTLTFPGKYSFMPELAFNLSNTYLLTDISEFKNAYIGVIMLRGDKKNYPEIHIEDINPTKLKTLYCTDESSFTGDLMHLASTSVKMLSFNNSTVYGTIENFVDKLRSLGKTSGKIFNGNNKDENDRNWGNVTFNGQPAYGSIVWTENTIQMTGNS